MEFVGILWTEIIMRPMINSIALLHVLLFDSLGLSIIAFTFVISLLMLPLTIRQTRQMRAMSELQPKVKALQEKYGKNGDRRKLSQETMGLYKQAGVSPIGCLGPMFIQMPVWIGLYQAIFKAVPPTPEGLASLSKAFYSWNPAQASVPLSSSFVGMDLVGLVSTQPIPYNFLLPVLVGVSMWVQQKITTMPSPDPKQHQTNQMMLWMMPIMFAFFAFQFPAGLAVYILFSNLIRIGIQFLMTEPGKRGTLFRLRTTAPQPAVAAATAGRGTSEGDKEKSIDGDATVHGQDGSRGHRPRARHSRAQTRRSRNRRR
ncbi:MAG: membrane protein insertase YidC [Chloroflexi bacterium]|nr:membrane protein insertase YidC [Chloroflexota bacterium]